MMKCIICGLKTWTARQARAHWDTVHSQDAVRAQVANGTRNDWDGEAADGTRIQPIKRHNWFMTSKKITTQAPFVWSMQLDAILHAKGVRQEDSAET